MNARYDNAMGAISKCLKDKNIERLPPLDECIANTPSIATVHDNMVFELDIKYTCVEDFGYFSVQDYEYGRGYTFKNPDEYDEEFIRKEVRKVCKEFEDKGELTDDDYMNDISVAKDIRSVKDG